MLAHKREEAREKPSQATSNFSQRFVNETEREKAKRNTKLPTAETDVV